MEAARRAVNGGSAYPGRRRSPYVARSRDRSPYIARSRDRSPYIKASGRSRSPYIALPRAGRSEDRSPYVPRGPRSRSPPARAGARSPLGMGRVRGRSPPRIGRSRSPLGIGHLGERASYLSASLGPGYPRSPSPYLSRRRSPLGLGYPRSPSPYLSLSRLRSPLGLGYPRSRSPPDLYRGLSPLWTGRGRSPLGIGYKRSLSPYPPLYIGLSPARHDGPSRGRSYRSPPRRARHNRSRSPRFNVSKQRSFERGRTSRPVVYRERPRASRGYVLQVKNLPAHCKDESVQQGLQHTFKKYGPIGLVDIHGTGEDRCALITYKDAKDRDAALTETKGMSFFGKELDVTIVKDPKPYSKSGSSISDNIVFSHKASMTLYVGNLAKETTVGDLNNTFKRFGKILHSEVKEIPRPWNYGFLQFSDIVSVYNAINEMNFKPLGTNNMRLGFGKSQPSRCIWVYGLLSTNSTKKTLIRHFSKFGAVDTVLHDTVKGSALVHFKERGSSVYAVQNGSIDGHKVKVLFANRRCQVAFCRSMESSGQNLDSFHKKILETSEDDPQIVEEDESQMVAEASDEEEAEMVAEESDGEEAQMVPDASDGEEDQMAAGASDEEKDQIAAGASDEEIQMEADASEEGSRTSETEAENQITLEISKEKPHKAETDGEIPQKK